MIRYALTCEAGHGFESWFASAEAYDTLSKGGQLSCPICGDRRITKTLMAPAVRSGRALKAVEESGAARPTLGAPADALEAALAELRRQVEANSEYVGMNFVAEARAIHNGDAPERSIFGEARVDEAKRLIEDGVPVAPLPFRPARRSH